MKKIQLYCLLLLPLLSLGQSIQIELDTNSILLGEQTNIRIGMIYRLDTGKEVNLQFPNIGDTLLNDIEVIEKGEIDTVIVDKENPFVFQQIQELTITSFTVGKYNLPSLTFILNEDTIRSSPIFFEVRDVVATENEALAEIKKPIDDPFTIWDWITVNWLYLLIGIGIILIVGTLLYYGITHKKKVEINIPEIHIPEHVIALEKLQAIEAESLWQNGEFKRYHSEISEVIREYLEKRFQVGALEQTTDEIFSALRFKMISESNKEKLHQLLVLADLVKFAKEIPIGSENEESMKNAFLFVDETKQVEEIVDKSDHTQIS